MIVFQFCTDYMKHILINHNLCLENIKRKRRYNEYQHICCEELCMVQVFVPRLADLYNQHTFIKS
jgi:hypothetical protein